MIEDVKKVYKSERDQVEDKFKQTYETAVQLARKVGVEPAAPRIAKRQIGRANNPSTTTEEHFRRNVAIPFIDHIIQSLDQKFDSKEQKII